MGWFSILVTCFVISGLFTIAHIAAAFLLSIILSATVILVLRENDLRRTELHRKTRAILNEISLAQKLCSTWTNENYPNICCPLSPCVTLQWTYRDGRIVNLPWSLLVKGDYIIVRPGQTSPGACTEANGKRKFNGGETYGLANVRFFFSYKILIGFVNNYFLF